MSRDASITLDCWDGTYHFRLAWIDLERLQESLNSGPWEIASRFHSGAWRVGDISHVIRCALIGGGLSPAAAQQKVRLWVESRPPMENFEIAVKILTAGLDGVQEEAIKKKDNQESEQNQTSPTEKSDFVMSIPTVQ